MKRITMTLLIVLLMSGVACGAVSDDVYVRKDVYEANMQSMNTKLDMILEQQKELQEEQKAMRKDLSELTKVVSVMSERIDRNFDTLSARIDGLDKRMDSLDKRIDDLRNGIYLWLVAIGLVVAVLAWPKVQDKLPKWGKATPSITLEDVKRLIEENNARMAGKIQA